MTSQYAQSLKVWTAGGAVGALGLAVLGWVALVGPQLSHVSATKSQTQDAQLQNLMLMSKVSRLRAENEKLASLTAQLSEIRTELPADSGMPNYIRQVLAQAATAGVTVTSLTAGAPSAVVSATATAVAPGGDPTGHLFQIPISLASTGSLANQRKLMRAVQTIGPRRALVSTVQFSPVTAGGSDSKQKPSIDAATTMTATLQVFVAPQNPAAEAALKKQLGG